MGAGIAEELAARGYRLAILSSSGRGEALAERLGGLGVTGSNLVPADLERLVDATLERYGRIDAVANSAGHGPKGELLALSDDDWQLGMETYFLNVVRMCRLVTPVMERQGKGALVNVSTYAVFEPEASFPTSGAFRASLAAFTKLYADRYAPRRHPHEQRPAGLHRQPARATGVQANGPLGRYGTYAEVAQTAAFLLSDRRGLHHRPEPARRRRHHALGVRRRRSARSTVRCSPPSSARLRAPP